MTRNGMQDLTDHLFAELERLGDEDLEGEELKAEIARAHAVEKVGRAIIEGGDLMLRTMRFNDEKLDAGAKLPPLLGGAE